MIRRALVIAAATAALSACGSQHGPEENPSFDNPAVEETAIAAPTGDRVIPPRNFDNELLGARIQGPVGTEVNASLADDEGTIGDIESYVACPGSLSECDPARVDENTIFTYVHVVTPGEDDANDDIFPNRGAAAEVTAATSFRLTVPATGFAGEAGYSVGEARSALGPEGAFVIRCEGGMLVFEPSAGDTWSTGETVTFFWRSSVPPAGPDIAYALIADGRTATGQGPAPAPDKAGSGC